MTIKVQWGLDALEAPTLWRGHVQVADRAGHDVPVEQPETFERLVGEFVDEIDSGMVPARA